METIYDALRESHATQRSLCRSLVRSTGERCNEVLKSLGVELSAHASAEERYLYMPMLMSDAGLSCSRHALSEHHEIEELVEELRELETAGEAWAKKARELSKTVHHHLKEEESAFFQLSGKLLTEAQKVNLASNYRRDFDRLHAKYSAE